ncbi:MAG: hypothetical protein PF904_00195 [Kiritimatiellae bacterium]|jgi:hypothetical protein|nr:hypothetical protein [Kiritimatiellia bacterium]
MNLVSTLWECHMGRIFISEDPKTRNFFAADKDGKSMGLGKPQNTNSDIHIMFQQLWEQDMIESILDKDDEYIRTVLRHEPDFNDADGHNFRFAIGSGLPGEMRIKVETAGKYATGWSTYKKYDDIRKMAGDWNRLKFRLEAEEVTDVEVLSPVETLPALRPAVLVDYTADAVMSQYKRAIGGTLEIIRFGAMLIEIDTVLTRENSPKARHSWTGKGAGLMGWMDENCPEINYKTAMRYKTLAQGLQDMFKIPAKLPLSYALPASDGSIDIHLPEGCRISEAKVKKIQMQVWEMVEGKSARQLTFDFGLADPKPRGGDHKSGKDTKKLTKEEQYKQSIDDAVEVFKTGIDKLNGYVKDEYHLLLPANSIKTNLTKLSALTSALKDALKETEK